MENNRKSLLELTIRRLCKIILINFLCLSVLIGIGIGIGIGIKNITPQLYGGSCLKNNDCYTVSELGYICINEICVCNNASYYSEYKCVSKKTFNESCISAPCDDSIGLKCINSICLCENEYFFNEEKCVRSPLYDAFKIINSTNSFSIIMNTSLNRYTRNFEIYNNKHYVSDGTLKKLIVYDENWVYVNFFSTYSYPFYLKIANDNFYYTNYDGMTKTDSQGNGVLNASTLYPNGSRSIYFDELNQYIISANYYGKYLDTFDLDLNLVNRLNVSTFIHGVNGFKGKIYVSGVYGLLFKVNNNQIINEFNTGCKGTINQITIDNAGVISLNCGKILYLCTIYGNCLNLTVTLPSISGNGLHGNFDIKGRFVVTAINSIVIYYV